MNEIESRMKHGREFIELAEDAAIGKIIDIRKSPSLKHGFVRFEPSDSLIDRLKEMFLSTDFIELDENYLPQRPIANSFEGAILMHHRLPQKIPREEVYTILIKSGRVQGIVLIDRAPSNRVIISKCIDFKSSTTKEAVGKTVQEMLSTYRESPNLCVPVYGLSGWIYWPFEADYKSLKSFLGGEKDAV